VRLQAEVHCYLCGAVSGTWEWLATTGPQQGILRALLGDYLPSQDVLTRVRCLRCGGSVYLDAVESVRVRELLSAENFWAARGRPRKPVRLVS
jgi:hypothetical protein